jgi:hypothetical protein
MKSMYRFSLVTLTLSALLVSSIFTAGCLRESQLFVQGINVGAEQVGASHVRLNITTDIQNMQGIGLGTPKVQLRAFNTETGLIETQRIDPVPGIGWGGALTVSQSIELPRKGSYRLIATVFEGDKRKGQGEITIYNLERLTPDTQQSGLMIEDIDFIAKKVSGNSAVIQTDIYLANGDRLPSGPFEVEVKAKETDAHLVADKQRTTIANVDPEKIVVATVLLTVPDQYNYIVEVLIWKNGTIIKRGEGSVQLRPGVQVSAGSQFVTKKIETSKFVSGDGPVAASPYPTPVMKSPGFSVPLIVCALAAIASLVIWTRRYT